MAQEIVVGTTFTNLAVTLVDEVGAPIDVTGAMVRLQGRANGGPAIDMAGTVVSGPAGQVQFAGFGAAIPAGQLQPASRVPYKMRVKFTLLNGKIGYGPEFDYDWRGTPA